MHYYDEEKMRSLRLKIEKELLSWPDVTTRKMYGCPCYKHKERLFAFLVTGGVVLTKANEQDKTTLLKEFHSRPFKAATRTMKGWPQIPIDKTTKLETILPFIKNSYNQSTL